MDSKNASMSSFRVCSSSCVGGFFATIYPSRNPLTNRIIINNVFCLYMLCFVFTLLLFVFHGYRVKYDAVYRSKTTHEKIDSSYRSLHLVALLLLPLSPHYVSKHLAVVDPSPLLLLWFVPERLGFNIVLTCISVNGVFGFLVACTYPLSLLEGCLVVMLYRTRSFGIYGTTRKYRGARRGIMRMG